MNEELKKALADALNAFKAELPAMVSKTEIEGLLTTKVTEIEQKFANKVTKEELEKVSKEMTELVAGLKPPTTEPKSLLDFTEAIKNDLKAVAKREKTFEYEVKTVGTVATSNVAVADPAPRLSILGPEGQLYSINLSTGDNIMDVVDFGTSDKPSITWVDEVAGEGSVGATNEGADKKQIDVDYQEKEAKAEKVTGFIKITEEALSDISFMASEIRRVLNEKINVKNQADVLAGIITNATAFNLTDYNGTVPSADIIDAIVVATAQSTLSGFAPKHIALNPIDIAKFQLAKSSNIPRVITTASGIEVNGLKVIKSTNVTKGTFVLGDFSKYRVRLHSQKLNIGWDGNDFTKNLRTILAETRIIKFVSSNEKTSFVKGTVATIISAINKAS